MPPTTEQQVQINLGALIALLDVVRFLIEHSLSDPEKKALEEYVRFQVDNIPETQPDKVYPIGLSLAGKMLLPKTGESESGDQPPPKTTTIWEEWEDVVLKRK